MATKKPESMDFVPKTSSSVSVESFGCRLNIYEGQVVKDLANQAGLDNTIIINTCAVTNEAKRQARQAVRKAKKLNPNARVVVTGCAAQIDPDEFLAMDEVDQVIGNQEKMQLDSYRATDPLVLSNIMDVKETANHLIGGFDGHTRAFIQVQNGCDHRCTFCTIPYGRGPNRSVPMGHIVNQVRQLVDEGYKEIVLTGVDVTAYGPDLPGSPTFGQMIRRLLAAVPELPRLRLSSLDPVEVDDDLFDLIATEPRLMPHLHISLQAGDDMVLKRMKRRHLRADVVNFCAKVRTLRPDVVFGADIIAGFPTETDDMFENTYNLVSECDLTYLHVFPYSPVSGTPAARMPQVVGDIKKHRAKRLRDKGIMHLQKKLLQNEGKRVKVLIETEGKGHSEHFLPVKLKDPLKAVVGDCIELYIESVDLDKNVLIGS
jgi:threonylcarbamoyladenosine tRNA methylthiotransferase MtaB